MDRRKFLRGCGANRRKCRSEERSGNSFSPSNWGKYDSGSEPSVTDRLNQGLFPQDPSDAIIPNDQIVMTTIPSEEVVPNYGKGLVTYILADMGTARIKSDHIPRAIEDLVRLPRVKSNENDANDAEAIAEAVTRFNMRFVSPKSVEEQDIQCLHRMLLWLRDRVGLGHASQYRHHSNGAFRLSLRRRRPRDGAFATEYQAHIVLCQRFDSALASGSA